MVSEAVVEMLCNINMAASVFLITTKEAVERMRSKGQHLLITTRSVAAAGRPAGENRGKLVTKLAPCDETRSQDNFKNIRDSKLF